MLSLLTLFLSQMPPAVPPSPTPTPQPQEILQPQPVRPLPGQLDRVPVFNSNSPEVVQAEGILLSTFPREGKQVAEAHLNFPFQGRFDIFAHHIAKPVQPQDLRTLYLGILLHNPGKQAVTVKVLEGASYLSQPDAPFIPMEAVVENPDGTVYAGPGSRVMNEVLRGMRQAGLPEQIVIPPGESRMLMNAPIPVRELTPPLNGRSSLMRLSSDRPVYAASLALFARQNADGTERAPTLAEWDNILQRGNLVSPRDRVPTPPEQTTGPIIYGRVAGVALGSSWQGTLVDSFPNARQLTIPAPGTAFSYGISTLDRGTLGTGQIQTAPMVVRYPDTAYKAHGNYGIHYRLSLPLHNPTRQTQTVTVALQTPIKQDQIRGGLRFFDPLPPQVFFRGTVKASFTNDRGQAQTRYVHLVQRRGQRGEPLVTLKMPPSDRRSVTVELLYPPDATPPQVLTVQTLAKVD